MWIREARKHMDSTNSDPDSQHMKYTVPHIHKESEESAICTEAGSIEWFIKGQVFSPSHDLVPPPPPLLSQRRLSLLTIGRGGGGWAKSYDDEKAFFSTNLSIVSGHNFISSNFRQKTLTTVSLQPVFSGTGFSDRYHSNFSSCFVATVPLDRSEPVVVNLISPAAPAVLLLLWSIWASFCYFYLSSCSAAAYDQHRQLLLLLVSLQLLSCCLCSIWTSCSYSYLSSCLSRSAASSVSPWASDCYSYLSSCSATASALSEQLLLP